MTNGKSTQRYVVLPRDAGDMRVWQDAEDGFWRAEVVMHVPMLPNCDGCTCERRTIMCIDNNRTNAVLRAVQRADEEVARLIDSARLLRGYLEDACEELTHGRDGLEDVE